MTKEQKKHIIQLLEDGCMSDVHGVSDYIFKEDIKEIIEAIERHLGYLYSEEGEEYRRQSFSQEFIDILSNYIDLDSLEEKLKDKI
jgi:hypothetical protein